MEETIPEKTIKPVLENLRNRHYQFSIALLFVLADNTAALINKK